MVSQDINRVIEIIDQRITSLQQIRKMLLDEFGIGNNLSATGIVTQAQIFGKTGSRKNAVKTLLEKEGSLGIREIIQKTGFPRGTITAALNDKRIFGNKEGKWYLLAANEERIKEAPLL